jgi:hypothetical protein
MKCLVDDPCCVSRDKCCFFCLCGAFLWPIGDGMYMWGMWGMDWQLVEWNQTQAITLKSWICDFQVTLWWFKIAMESYGKGSIYGRITCEIVMFHNHVRWPDVCDMWVMCIPFHSVWIKHRAHQKKQSWHVFNRRLGLSLYTMTCWIPCTFLRSGQFRSYTTNWCT